MSYREDLILAAVRAFARRGPEGTTVSDIAHEAGVSQPRISQVFGSKEQAWSAAFSWSTSAIVDEVARQVNQQLDTESAWTAARMRYPDAMMVLLHCLSSANHFPSLRESMYQAVGEFAAVAVDHNLAVDEFVRNGFMACVELSLGVQSLRDLAPRLSAPAN